MHQHITKMLQHTLNISTNENIFWTPEQHYISKIISTKRPQKEQQQQQKMTFY